MNANFFMVLFPSYPEGVLAEVRAIRQGKVKRHWVRSATDLVGKANELRESCDVYFGVGARRGHNGGREAVAYTNALWADLDKPVDDSRRILDGFGLEQWIAREAGLPQPPAPVVSSLPQRH